MVTRQTSINVVGSMLLACALLLPAAAHGAAPAALSDRELDEILVQGAKVKPDRDAVKILGWLRRFVGQFTYTGYVEVRAQGMPRQRQGVAGVSTCVAFGDAPGVHCTVNVVWPEVHGANGEEVLGGASTLAPAMIQLGLDPDRLGVRFLQVDSHGIAERGNGYLISDTLTTTTPCVGIPDCQRITRIDAHPDGQFIEMQVDIEKDGNRVVRYLFVMTRQAPKNGGDASGEPGE